MPNAFQENNMHLCDITTSIFCLVCDIFLYVYLWISNLLFFLKLKIFIWGFTWNAWFLKPQDSRFNKLFTHIAATQLLRSDAISSHFTMYLSSKQQKIWGFFYFKPGQFFQIFKKSFGVLWVSYKSVLVCVCYLCRMNK